MSFESLASSYPQDCRIPHLENNSYIYGNPPSGQLAHSGVDFRVSNEKSDSKYQNFTSTPENIIKKSPERRYQDYYQRISLYKDNFTPAKETKIHENFDFRNEHHLTEQNEYLNNLYSPQYKNSAYKHVEEPFFKNKHYETELLERKLREKEFLDRQQAIKDQIARESFEYFKNKQMNHTENDQSMYKDYEDKEVLYTQSNEKIRSSSNKNFQPRHSNDFENSAKKKTGRNSQHKTLYNSNTKKKRDPDYTRSTFSCQVKFMDHKPYTFVDSSNITRSKFSMSRA